MTGRSHAPTGDPKITCGIISRGACARKLAASAMGLALLLAGQTATAQTITVDASSSVSGNPHFWSTCVGTGSASFTLRADLQTHYQLANRELGMERVRGHGVLNDDMGIFSWDGSGAPSYDWSNYDTYLAAIAAANMRPIIELSFMPTDLATQGSDINPAKDLAVYADFIEAVVGHTVEVFGEQDVSQWYWEVWNEPNYEGFWTGTMDDYFEMYDAAVEGATRVLPEILIGGPVTTQDSTSEIQAFLQHVKANDTRLSFVSSHAYPGGAGETASASFAVSDNDSRLSVMESEGFGDLISMNTEWNTAYTGQGGNTTANNVSMDSHANAPFILKTVKLLADQNQGDQPPLGFFSYWAVSDVFGEYNGLINGSSYIETQGGGTLPFGSVFGLMTYQGVRKASFNAFKMLNYLGDDRLAVSGGTGNMDGVDAIATVSADGSEVSVIVFNYYATINTSGSDSVTVNIDNLPFAGEEVFVTQFGIDEQHSNPYSVWESEGSPSDPSEEVWRAMREASQLALLEPVTSITAESTYSTTLDLPRQGAAMIILSQQRPVTGRDALTRIEAEDYDGQSSATKEASNDESMGQSITASDGGYLYFSQVDFSDAGVDGVQLRVNSQGAATVELRTDSPDGTLLGTCEVAATGDQWETQACALTPTTGVHPLYAVFGGGMRLNWLLFDSSAGEDGSEATDDGTGAGGGAGSDDGGETMPDAADDAAGGMAGASGAADAAGDPTATGAGGSSTGAADDTAAADDTVGTPATTDDSVPTGDTSTAGTTADGTTTVDTTTGSAPPPGGAAAAAGMPSASSSAGAMPEVASTVDEGGDSGCGCRITAPRGAPVGLWGLLGLCALGLMRRRRLC